MPNPIIAKLTCLRCGASWWPRTPTLPRYCAKCNSPYWFKPRVVRPGAPVTDPRD